MFSASDSLKGKSLCHASWRRFLWLSMSLKSLVSRFKSCHLDIFWRIQEDQTFVWSIIDLRPHIFPWPCIFHSAFQFIFQFILLLSSYTHYIVFPFLMLLKCLAHRIFPIQKAHINKENGNTFEYNIYWNPHSAWWQKLILNFCNSE